MDQFQAIIFAIFTRKKSLVIWFFKPEFGQEFKQNQLNPDQFVGLPIKPPKLSKLSRLLAKALAGS